MSNHLTIKLIKIINVAFLNSIHTSLQQNCVTESFIIIYHCSTPHTAPPIHLIAMPQCSSRCRDGNMGTAMQM